tara:strand:- start:6331 stop:7380 length:1050 start_codon:yes stop_codon:yes gene_type:complete
MASDAGSTDTAGLRKYNHEWSKIIRPYAEPVPWRSILQLVTTILPLAGLWTGMMLTVDQAYYITLLMAVPTAAFIVRLFIIQHDCGHRSYFRSRRLNDLVGNLIGIITLTPHAYWRRAHNIHHATCGNLEQRGIGDVDVLTVAEYRTLSFWKRLAYRIYRAPAIMLGIGPVYLFVIKYRLPLDLIRRHPKLFISVMGTNFGIAGVLTALGVSFGFMNVMMVHAPVVFLSSAIGVWLFYIQHQFEQTYWKMEGDWNFHEASVMASSYYDLPQPLRWFSGDIGIHHIHHLSCRIPNYRLRAGLAEIPELQQLNRIGLRDSLLCFRLALWDEKAQRLISFRNLRQQQSSGIG